MPIAQLDTQTLVTRILAMLDATGGPVALVEDEDGVVTIGVIDADPTDVAWLDGWQPIPIEDVAA